MDITGFPKDLDKQSKLIWTRTRDVLKKMDTWEGEYSLLLERYVRALEVGRQARARIAGRDAELDELRPEWLKTCSRLQMLQSTGLLEADEATELKKVERNLMRTAYTAWGSQGQLVPHPDLKTAREAERDANDYARELLLTPASRAKGGDTNTKPAKAGTFGGGAFAA